MPDVICLGELLIDFVSTQPDASLAESPGFVKAPGGAPANVAVALVRMGISAGFIGKVGNDPFGHYLKSVLEGEGVDCQYLAFSDEARTTLAFIGVRRDGAKDIAFYRNPGADMMLSPDDLVPGYVLCAKAFHFGSISMIDEGPRAATMVCADLARENGLLVSYDPNFRPALWDAEARARDVIWEGFELADVAKVSEEEWEFITGTDDFAEGAKKILDKGVKLVVMSRGESGCCFANGRHAGELAGLHVDVAETIGAGDGFVGAMLAGLLDARRAGATLDSIHREHLLDLLRVANAAGALTCTKVGAIPALPTRDEVRAFLERTG